MNLKFSKLGLLAQIFFASVGALLSIYTVISFWGEQIALAEGESIWPQPGILFVEILVFSILGLISSIRDKKENSNHWGLLIWAIAGGLVSTAILSFFSIGIFILPSALIFLCVALLADLLNGRYILFGFGSAFLIGIANGIFMIQISLRLLK